MYSLKVTAECDGKCDVCNCINECREYVAQKEKNSNHQIEVIKDALAVFKKR